MVQHKVDKLLKVMQCQLYLVTTGNKLDVVVIELHVYVFYDSFLFFEFLLSSSLINCHIFFELDLAICNYLKAC